MGRCETEVVPDGSPARFDHDSANANSEQLGLVAIWS